MKAKKQRPPLKVSAVFTLGTVESFVGAQMREAFPASHVLP